jgi:signal transduction histidine kinase
MKVKNKSYSVLLVILSCLVALVATVSAVTIYQASTVNVITGTDSELSVFVGDIDRGHVSFEDSNLFSVLFSEDFSDITRMCVIKNQMETDGSFDADKKINISSYANRSRTISGENVSNDSENDSVKYRLDDLIKWGNYGFDFIPVTGTPSQLDAYIYSLVNNVDMPTVTSQDSVVHYDREEYYDVVYQMTEALNSTDDSNTYTIYLLVDRYKPVAGGKLTDYVANRKEYTELVSNICSSANDLFNNYTEYMEYGDKYGDGKTNVLYCYQLKNSEGKLVRYSNLSQNVKGLSNDDLSRIFTGHVKYACFNPDKLQTASNIESLNSVFMKNVISGYEYSFGDGSRVWLAIDESYGADDVYVRARSEYNKTSDVFYPACIALVASMIVYLILLVVMTIQAGKVLIIDEEGEKTQTVRPAKWDSIPVEIYAIVTGVIAVLAFSMLIYLYYETPGMKRMGGTGAAYVIWGAAVVLANAVLIPLYLMLVRKIKCKLMWKGSITKWCVAKVKSGIIDVYDNGQLVIRTWLPYLLFLAFNLVLVLLGVGGIIIAFIIDILVGLLLYHETKTRNDIVAGISRISGGELAHKIDTSRMHGDNLALANAVNNIGDGISKAVNTSMRDEKMKADLITNVSHDIKTPLTSIINYVDLLKRENISDEKIRGYVDILDQKSQRLKQLTDDLVEASKISSGNISLNIEKINFVELIHQSAGEFSEKFEEKGLKIVLNLPAEPVHIMADSRGIYRVVENLYNNVYKYALEGTRVYVDMVNQENGPDGQKKKGVMLSIKNISADPLNISAEELTERFMRGDASRKTEGSGLGLSIAKSLTEAMGGNFSISLDGDLFKAVITFDAV